MIRPLRMRSRPIASHVLTKRMSFAGRSPSSETRSTLASSAGSPNAPVRTPCRLVPGFDEDAFAQLLGMHRPVFRAVGDAEAPGDPAEPVAGRPAQGRRIGVGARAAAIFPESGVGLERQRERPLAQRLQQAVERLVAHPRQPFVDEHLCCGKHDAAIDVVLRLQRGLIADADRTMPEKPFQVGRDRLVERRERHDAVHRLDLAGVRGDRHDVVDVGFHDPRRAEPVQRVDDEIGVPQPAEPVVPVAGGVRRLGDRRRMRGDDRPRLPEAGQLQGDRRANDGRLPFERRGERARPLVPMLPRPLEKVPAGRIDSAEERFILAEDQRHRPRQRKGDFIDDVGERRVGRQPHDLGARRRSGCDWSQPPRWSSGARNCGSPEREWRDAANPRPARSGG